MSKTKRRKQTRADVDRKGPVEGIPSSWRANRVLATGLELVGRSPTANYLLGRKAFERGDFSAAKGWFALALQDLPGASEQEVIRGFVRQCEQRGAVERTGVASVPLQP